MFNNKKIQSIEGQLVNIGDQILLIMNSIKELGSAVVQVDDKLSKRIDENLREVQGVMDSMVQTIHNLEERLVQVESHNDRLKLIEEQLIEFAKRDQNAKTPDMMKYSTEPWMQFVGGEVDPVKGVAINLDWNTAFVDQLRRNGFTGINELQIVSQFLVQVASKHQMDI